MRVDLSDLKPSLLLISCLTAMVTACAEPPVGAPCLPEQVPEFGFDEREAYIESSSVQCETRVCLVYELDGDPREGCVPKTCAVDEKDCQERLCSDPGDVEDRIYCSCRCDAPSDDFAECDCPDGFSCTPVLRKGGAGVQGSYCVKTSTLNQG